jgi:hypothetical protein
MLCTNKTFILFFAKVFQPCPSMLRKTEIANESYHRSPPNLQNFFVLYTLVRPRAGMSASGLLN